MEIFHDFASVDHFEMLFARWQHALGHDLPNQLVALQGFARSLESDADSSAADVRFLAGRIAALARQVDEQVRALAKQGKLVRPTGAAEIIDLEKLAREAAAEVTVLFKGQAIDYHFQHPMPSITTYRTPLYCLWTHLLRNAARAAVAGRPLVVEMSASRNAAGALEMSVRDNGCGMSQLQLQKAQAALSSGAATGFGVVGLVVASWHGSVRIASDDGQGTSVTIVSRGF